MILKSLKIKNIRSYLDEEIIFPAGSLLLSGDIGAGKSTILLAIEFALFGIQRGALSGPALLRAGKNDGFVELVFEIGKREIILKRTLKRMRDAVVQSTGYIVIDGALQDCTAIELKSKILSLLGYPKELITKKQLIYRYTVYTPQEEMKQILFEDREARLDILRKVFGIDKYKRIKENTQIYIRELKERQKRFEAIAEDIYLTKKEVEAFHQKFNETESKISELKPHLFSFQRELTAQKIVMENIEHERKTFVLIKGEFDKLCIELKHILHQLNNNGFQIEELQKQIATLETEVSGKSDDKNLSTKIRLKQDEILILERQLKSASSAVGELTAKQTNSLTLIEKIKKLNVCPVCMQEVNLTHKQYITNKENKSLEGFERMLDELDSSLKSNESKIRLIREELELLRGLERDSALIKLRLKNLAEKKELRHKIQNEQALLQNNVAQANAKKQELFERLGEFGNLEEKYLNEMEKLELLAQQERAIAIKNAALKNESENLAANIAKLDIELKKKQAAARFLEQTKSTKSWLENYLLVLVDLIEKQVMANIHTKFNDMFVSFFKELLEDDNTTARLDDSFTPIFTQNGYEVEAENLSGGEKTSCALAYRLALNRVINDLISSIKTNDILILDEPTDGFSTEQLDNLKKVLEMISIKQIIIVSHEQKVEAFVDYIIDISKTDHISSSVAREVTQ